VITQTGANSFSITDAGLAASTPTNADQVVSWYDPNLAVPGGAGGTRLYASTAQGIIQFTPNAEGNYDAINITQIAGGTGEALTNMTLFEGRDGVLYIAGLTNDGGVALYAGLLAGTNRTVPNSMMDLGLLGSSPLLGRWTGTITGLSNSNPQNTRSLDLYLTQFDDGSVQGNAIVDGEVAPLESIIWDAGTGSFTGFITLQGTRLDFAGNVNGGSFNGTWTFSTISGTFSTMLASRDAWAYRNLSAVDLTNSGLTTPAFVGGLTSYVTPWNGLNIAGLDGNGDIHTVWTAPGLAGWTTSNLSNITGAPTLTGGLSPYLTSWGGINLAGANQSGDLTTTWWVPGGQWSTFNLTASLNGPQLQAASTTTYVTSWDGLNIVGLDADGDVIIYWWAPGQAEWTVTPLGAAIAGDTPPVGPITGVTGAAGRTSIVGTNNNDQVVRYTWAPGDVWKFENISSVAAFG
jgi:hypothetical protein